MARKATREDTSEHSTDAISECIDSTQFKIFNRAAATKPIGHVLALLDLNAGNLQTRLAAESKSDQDQDQDQDQDDYPAYVHVASATEPRVFGIRVGIHVEDEKHVLVIDASVEYGWNVDFDYTRDDFESFLSTEAAPRAAAATWTIVEELARSIGAEVQSEMAIPAGLIAHTVLQQLERTRTRQT